MDPVSTDFPRMIYHPIEGLHIVKDEAELQLYLKKGWSKSVVPADEETIFKSRIAEYETDLETMRENLASLSAARPENLCYSTAHQAETCFVRTTIWNG